MRIILISVFGVLGTLARYGLQGLVQEHSGAGFPAGTMAVNLSGCFFLGLIGQFALNHLSFPPDWRIAIAVGFFGAFTTFSTFSWEAGHMMLDGEWWKAAAYVGISLFLGVFLLLAGLKLADRIS